MAKNFLQLNESKSEVILFGSNTKTNHIINNMGTLSTLVKHKVNNLGVIFDSDLKFNSQVNSVVQTSFFHLRTITKIKPFLSPADLGLTSGLGQKLLQVWVIEPEPTPFHGKLLKYMVFINVWPSLLLGS